ncbi:triosephosphate isomerase [Mycoplasmopsis arginini]|uniref:triose-phosphate isomerase n=1 Tax=Mycoplasmopsis arginini TaxID=2094 RepID=UPI000A27BE5D|nr:triosephosphate isomerase [Chlamydia abortus]SGA05753.1 triosephosphate isomerase [Mycoplasmopsis arginini]SGA19806.1 triosephosphate isomerase [Mycoplasmopsis arginini]SGA31208.1 triosephosphate isomerase [Chlamydia abortus]
MKYLIGNFKMNKTFLEVESYIDALTYLISENKQELKDLKIGIAPSFDSTYISYNNPTRNYLFGLQNIFHELNGAYTGEVSLNVAKEANIDFILVGHSERRKLFNETDELINKKILQLKNTNITAILCVGESLEEFESNQTFEVLQKQIKSALKNVHNYSNILISYEPVYCIGNGITPKAQHIQKVVDFIHELLEKSIPILYGGSVCCSSIDLLEQVKGLSGYLVGKASLNAYEFINLAKKIK